MISLAFFNNKGGVGKTTLACNMAAHAAIELNLRVLMVDMDPQCNATQLMLTEDQWETIYSKTDESARKTVMQSLRHIRAGDSSVDTDVIFHGSERFKCDVLAGHPVLSTIEDRLSASWVDYQGGDLGGARRTSWVRTLVNTLPYDLVLFDCGPSLGALNRCTLIGSDVFVTPMAADLFSLYALDNIGGWMRRWLQEYARGFAATREKSDDNIVEDYGLLESPPIAQGYIGYTVQQYVTRNAAGASRSVYAYDRYKNQIPERARGLEHASRKLGEDLNLGVVPNMFSMVPLAQSQHSPIRGLTSADGVRGAQVSQQRRYAEQLTTMGNQLFSSLKIDASEGVVA